MKKGFVTFVNNSQKYQQLNDLLIESIINLTDYDIEVFGINCTLKHSSNRVINRTINLKDECIDTIFYSKIYSSYASDFDIGLQLDSDMIVTPDAIRLFEEIDPEYPFVKGSLHPWNGLEPAHIAIMNKLGAKQKSQPYIHATYLFTKNSKDFLKEAYDIGMNFFKSGVSPINYDETVLNTLLWKNNVNDANVVCYDPYFEYFKKHLGMPTNEDVSKPYGDEDNFLVRYLICHGCKNIEDAQRIYANLLKKGYVK
jgi:hypothetical protein